MATPLKFIIGGVLLAGAIYLGRLAYIKYAYPSHDSKQAKDLAPAGGQEPNPIY